MCLLVSINFLSLARGVAFYLPGREKLFNFPDGSGFKNNSLISCKVATISGIATVKKLAS